MTYCAMQDEYADASDPLPEGLIGNLKEFDISYTEVRKGMVVVALVVALAVVICEFQIFFP